MTNRANRKILIVVNSLQAGGAEHAALRLATDLSQESNDVIFCTLHEDRDFYEVPRYVKRMNYGDIFFYPSNSDVKLSRFPLINSVKLYWLHFKSIRKFVRNIEPDIVVVFEAFVGSVFAVSLIQTGIPIIISERIDPNPRVYEPHIIARLLRPWVYKHGAICTVQSRGFQRWVKDNWNIKAFVTPNHLHDSEIEKYAQSGYLKSEKLSVIAIGRIAEQKDYSTLLHAWRIVEVKNPNARLSIFGDGEKSELSKLIFELGLINVNYFPATQKILEELANHQILASSSKFEGFPNVILESLACGVPVVATRSTDVIHDFEVHGGVKSCKVGDFHQLANLILQLINNETEYVTIKKQALKTARYYKWSNIKYSWENVFKTAQKSKGVKIIKCK